MVTVRVPATSANLGPGFDVMGLALPLYNRLTLTLGDQTAVTHEGPEAAGLHAGDDHLSLVAARRVAELAGRELPLCHWRIDVVIPPARGLGSSSAAIVGGIVAANALLGHPLDREAMLAIAADIEGHPDNVAPALYGGVTAAFMDNGLTHCIPLATSVPATLVVAVPDFRLATAEARAVLPTHVPRADAIANLAHVTALTTVMLTGDVKWWPLALRDRLHQPYRLGLVSGADAVFQAALDAGAWGTVISGAGPTLLAVTPTNRAEAVADAMRDAWAQRGIAATVHVFTSLAEGAGAETAGVTS